MEDVNGNQHIRRLPIGYPSESLQSLYLPLPEINHSGRYPRGVISPSTIDPQSLVSSFSGLNLSSSNHHQRQPHVIPGWKGSNFGGTAVVGSSTVAEEVRGVPPFPTMERSAGHYSNSMRGFGGTHMNQPFIGADNYQVYQGDRNSWVTSQFQNAGNGVNPQYEFGQNDVLSPFFVPKKQWGNQFKPCSSTVPCPSRITCLSDFDGSDVGLVFNGMQRVVRPNPSYGQQLNLSLMDLRGKILSIAKDQSLSRILQDKLESPTQEEIEMVISEVIDHMTDLMTDQYGNYIFQKLVKVCNVNDRTRIIGTLSRPRFQLVLICRNLLGSRSAQKLLEFISTPEQISMIMSALVPGVLELATDQHGYHVLQQCLKSFSDNDNQVNLCFLLLYDLIIKIGLLNLFNDYSVIHSTSNQLQSNGTKIVESQVSCTLLVMAIAERCFQIATNRCGCVVLHTCVDECSGELKYLIISEIIANASHLSEDPFGNYVVQRLLDLKIPKVTGDILRQLAGNFFFFSRNKFASNVVEKCLVEAEPAQSEQIIMELIRNPNISMLLVDPYGNFVIQSAFSVSQGRVRTNMIDMFQANAPILRSNLYGKNILQMLEKKKVRGLSQSSFSSFY
ncbi:pumilio homolog 12-like [Impatiens glandulifera]|uniref:pumilio homolog 12-like n=1 Tax=Impatiens glandulifera TaxID=253017 RepID=UPI001FB10993|nr:pumilio homolog 12-like [Impatiens glandulifera]